MSLFVNYNDSRFIDIAQKIFENYALWMYELLCNLMKDFDRDRIMQMMVDHYTITAEVLEADAKEMFSEKELEKAVDYLKIAIKVTKEAVTNIELSSSFGKKLCLLNPKM